MALESSCCICTTAPFFSLQYLQQILKQFEACGCDHALIALVAKIGKPMIMSTGMADKEETKEAISVAKVNGCKELVILHCVNGYPVPALATIVDMSQSVDVIAGLSEHTIDNAIAVAVVLCACIIEKHVILDGNGDGMIVS